MKRKCIESVTQTPRMRTELNSVLYDSTPHYYFSRGFVYVNIDCPECEEQLKFLFSWKEVMDGISKNITRFYGDCMCHKTIAFDIDKKILQGFTAESVLEAFEDERKTNSYP